MIGRWILFENDIHEPCGHPILCKMTLPEDPKVDGTALQVIISCDCDTTVFDHAWKAARDSDELIVVVGEMTHMDMIKMIAEQLK